VLDSIGLTVDSEHMDEILIKIKCQEALNSLREEAKRNDASRFTSLIKNRLDSRDDGILEFLLHKQYGFRDYVYR
jgi:hypothetical protein